MPSGDFDIRSDSFKRILTPDSKLTRLADGFGFTEGPVWFDDDGGYLLFSDILNERIMRWSATDGVSVFREKSGRSNGNYRDLQGRLVTAGHGNRNIMRTEPDGSVTVLAEGYQGKRFHSPNDIVVKSDGTIWFTDPPYAVTPEERELDATWVFRLDPETGEVSPATDELVRPNGLAFSPDESLLYVADSSDLHYIRVFDVVGGRLLRNGRIFAVVEPGIPDGFRVDTEGRVYTSARDGIQVFSPEAELLGKVLVDPAPANCCFGGPGKHTLYVTAHDALFSITLASSGAQRP